MTVKDGNSEQAVDRRTCTSERKETALVSALGVHLHWSTSLLISLITIMLRHCVLTYSYCWTWPCTAEMLAVIAHGEDATLRLCDKSVHRCQCKYM